MKKIKFVKEKQLELNKTTISNLTTGVIESGDLKDIRGGEQIIPTPNPVCPPVTCSQIFIA